MTACGSAGVMEDIRFDREPNKLILKVPFQLLRLKNYLFP